MYYHRSNSNVLFLKRKKKYWFLVHVYFNRNYSVEPSQFISLYKFQRFSLKKMSYSDVVEWFIDQRQLKILIEYYTNGIKTRQLNWLIYENRKNSVDVRLFAACNLRLIYRTTFFFCLLLFLFISSFV